MARFRVLTLLCMPWLLATASHAAALSFNSGTLGTGTISTTVYGFTPSGGTPPYTFSYTPSTSAIPGFAVYNSPDVPASLSAAQTGALIGIPSSASHTATTTYTASIRLTDSTGAFVDKSVTILVTPVDFAGDVPADTGVGDTVNLPFQGIDGTAPYTFSVSGTPPTGLQLSSAGVLNGTLTASGSFTFTVKMQDSSATPQTASRTFTMVVSALRIANVTNPANAAANRTLPNGTINVPYSFQFMVTGGTPPYTFAVGSGFSLPTGLSLSPGGILSGTVGGAAAAANYSFETQIAVSDTAGNALAVRIAIDILPTAPKPLSLSTATLSDVGLGDNTANGVAASGGVPPYSFNIAAGSTLPTGCFLINGTAALLNNAPDHGYVRCRAHTAGNYTFVLGVTDSTGNTATRPYNLHVSPIEFFYAGNLPVGSNPTAVLGSPYSWYLVPAGGVPPYTVVATEIPEGLAVDNTGFLSGTPAEVGNTLPLYLTLADSSGNTFNSSGNITINSSTLTSLLCSGGDLGTAQLGNEYSSNITCTGSPQNPPAFSVTPVGGSLPPGLMVLTGTNFDNNGNANVAAQIAGVPNTSGNYTYTIEVTDGLGNIGQRQIKLHVSNLAIVNTGIAPGTVGVAYNQSFDVRGGVMPYAFTTVGSLPTGLSISPTTGAISGTPTTSGSSAISIQVTDNSGDSIVENFTLDIYDVQIASPNVLPYAIYGVPYSYTFSVSPAGTYQWTTASTLPVGFTLNPSTGVLSGVTTDTTGIFTLAIVASNGSVSVTKTFTLFITSQSGQSILNGLPTQPLGDFTLGSQVRVAVDVNSGTPPYTVSLASGSSLPPGLSLVTNNQYLGNSGFGRYAIAGIPTTVGSYSFRVNYTDSTGLTEGRLLSMNVTKLALATTTPQDATVGVAYSAKVFGVGGNGTYTFALANLHDNVMPSGLTLSSSGVISGTPTSTGSFTVRLQMTSGTASRQIDITVVINPPSPANRIDFGFGPVINDVTAGRRALILITPTITPTSGIGTLTWSVVSGLPPGMQLLQGTALPPTYPGTTAPPQAVLAGPATPGNYNIGIKVTDSVGNFGIQYATWNVGTLFPGPVTATNNFAMPPGQAGVPYSFAVTPLSGQPPFTFAADVGLYLPGGMSLSPSGVLSGTPTDPGNYLLYTVITDANGVVQRLDTDLTVYPAGQPIGLAVSQNFFLPSGVVSTPYSYALNTLVSAGYGTAPFTWTIANGSSLPPGMSLIPGSSSSSAALAGSPSAAGLYSISLLCTDANGRTALSYSNVMYVSPIAVSPAGGGMPAATLGSPYSQSITASGGVAPYIYSLAYVSGIPPGLSLSPSGVLSGTPVSVTGSFFLDVFVTDAANNVTLQLYSMAVLPAGTSAGIVLSADPLIVNAPYVMGTANPTVPVTFSSNASSLPFSLSIATISGGSWLLIPLGPISTPATISFGFLAAGLPAGNYSATVIAIYGAGSQVTIQVNLTVIAPGSTSKLAFYPVSPCRVVDTRNTNGAFGGPILSAGSTRSFTIPSSSCGIPTTAQAYSLNVTVVPPASLGYLTIWPTGETQPYVSTLNSSNGAVIANAAIVPAGTGGAVSVYVSDSTHVIIDINGYFAPPSSAGLAFYPVTPCRVVDTRGVPGAFGGPSLSAGGTRSFTVPNSTCGIPAEPTAQAYSLNMTVVPPASLDYLTVWPFGQSQPYVSTLNALQGQVAANAAIVPAGAGSAISVFVSDASNVIIDINGYFSPAGSAGALYLYPVTPCRVADTRNATGTFGGPIMSAGSTRTFPMPSSSCGLPSTAQAYSLNMTVAPPSSLFYLTTWPAGQPQPVVSTLNDLQGQIIANAAIVPAGSSGAINVFVSDMTQLIIDVNGYFAQ